VTSVGTASAPPRVTPTWRIAATCAALAVVAAFGAALVTISIADWNVTVLVRMAREQPLASLAEKSDPDFAFVDFDGRGDGVYYYAVARDPLARGPEHELFVWSAYRYGHPGYSWAAWLLTAGNPVLIPFAFLLLNLVGIGAAAAAASFISHELGHTPWAGLLVALNPGLIYATTIDTSEPVAAALLALVLLAWLQRRWRLGLPALILLSFMKEWFVLVPLALGLWELLSWRQDGLRRALARSAAIWASLAPFGLWYLYVTVHFAGWPAAPAGDLLQLPLTGWVQTARLGARFGTETFDHVLVGHVTVPLLTVMGIAFALGIVRALRLRSPIDLAYLAFMPIVFGLNSANLLYTKDTIRTLAIPLALVPAVLASCAVRRPPLFLRKAQPATQETAPGGTDFGAGS
jgi:hypothetical protein